MEMQSSLVSTAAKDASSVSLSHHIALNNASSGISTNSVNGSTSSNLTKNTVRNSPNIAGSQQKTVPQNPEVGNNGQGMHISNSNNSVFSHSITVGTNLCNDSISTVNTGVSVTMSNPVVMTIPGSTNVGTVIVGTSINGTASGIAGVRLANASSTAGLSTTSSAHLNVNTTPNAQFVVKPEHQIRSPVANTKDNLLVQSSPVNVANSIIATGNLPNSVAKPAAAVNVVRPAGTQFQIVNVSNAARFSGSTQTVSHTPVKSLATRVVNTPIRIAPQQPQISGPRPQAANIGMALPPGMVLVKNELGHFMLVNSQQPGGGMTPATAVQTATPKTVATPKTILTGATTTPGTMIKTASGTTTILASQPVQISGGGVGIAAGGIATAGIRPGTVTATPQRHVLSSTSTQQLSTLRTATPTRPLTSTIATTPGGVPVVAGSGGTAMTGPQLEQVKKCKNFLSTLIRLAGNQPANTVRHVKDLVQKLIDAKIEPEDFTAKLQVELRSAPQPYLVPFLKKNLPQLRQSMVHNQLTIEDVRAPPVSVLVSSVIPAATVTTRPPVLMQSPTPAAGASTISTRPVLAGTAPIRAVPTPTMVAGLRGTSIRPVVTQPTLISTYQSSTTMNAGGVRPVAISTIGSRGTTATGTTTVKTSNRKLSATALAMARLNEVGIPRLPPPAMPPPPPPVKEKRKYDSLKDDDDINDVAAMGGVNLTEESRNILAGNMELIGGTLRTVKDQYFLKLPALQTRINAIARKHGLSDSSEQVAQLISHATQERMRNMIEKLSTVAEHRLELHKMDKSQQATDQVKSQIKFLEELDKLEKKRHDEAEREVLLRAAKSRSKHEDPEQLKLKEKAKAMKQLEADAIQHRDANETALAAIGTRKKRKIDIDNAQAGFGSSSTSSRSMLRPRIKRVNLRDLVFLLEQEKETTKSTLLFKTYMK